VTVSRATAAGRRALPAAVGGGDPGALPSANGIAWMLLRIVVSSRVVVSVTANPVRTTATNDRPSSLNVIVALYQSSCS
jgi:hypothetical protein